MDTDQFDRMTTRVAGHVTRRRSLGLLGLLGVAGLGLAADAEAGKKGKRKRRKKHKKPPQGPQEPACTGCTACEACVKGACAPLADGAPCGEGGVCTNTVCGQPCTFADDACPGSAVCPLENTVCVTDFACDAPCATDDDCAAGEICMFAPCGGFPGALVCGQIAAI